MKYILLLFSIFYTIQINAQVQRFTSFITITSENTCVIQDEDTSKIAIYKSSLHTTLYLRGKTREVIVFENEPDSIYKNPVGITAKRYIVSEFLFLEFLYGQYGGLHQIIIVRDNKITAYIILPKNEWL